MCVFFPKRRALNISLTIAFYPPFTLFSDLSDATFRFKKLARIGCEFWLNTTGLVSLHTLKKPSWHDAEPP